MSEASYEELYGRDKEDIKDGINEETKMTKMVLMKDYIKNGNNLKKYDAVNKSDDIKVNISKAISEMFLVQEVNSSISYLEELFRVDANNRNNDETKTLPTCQNTCNNWRIYLKRCRIYLDVPIQ